MKKIIASVMLACFGASILIAEVPAAVAASDPFGEVEGVELTVVEEGEVEGGFVPVAVAGVVITADVVAKALVTGGCIAVVGSQIKQIITHEDKANSSVPGSQDHTHGTNDKKEDWAVNKDGTAHHKSSAGVRINNNDASKLREQGYNIPKSGIIPSKSKTKK